MNKLGGNFGELMKLELETRSCADCGGTFRVLHSSDQQYCCEYCARKDSHTGRWKSWHKDQDYLERKEGRRLMK